MKEHFHQGDCNYGRVLIVLASISDGDVWLFSPCPQSVANRWRSSCGISESIFNEKQKKALQPRGAAVKAAPEPLFLQLHPDKETPDLWYYY